MDGKRSRREIKTETMRKGEVENINEKSAKTTGNLEDDNIGSRPNSFQSNRKDAKIELRGKKFR